jgi:hypothetical protein
VTPKKISLTLIMNLEYPLFKSKAEKLEGKSPKEIDISSTLDTLF